jgi:hypothetical protein
MLADRDRADSAYDVRGHSYTPPMTLRQSPEVGPPVTIEDWNGRPIPVVRTRGGVVATVNPFDNVVHGSVTPWPPPELVQKLYASRQSRAFEPQALSEITRELGYYSDLQSLHSEDALTWSVFGPLVYGPSAERSRYVRALCEFLELPVAEGLATVWLWRRFPHPNSRVPGGPEVDVGIQTRNLVVLLEAKWRSGIGERQGVNGGSDQIALRHAFCTGDARRIFPACEFAIVGASPDGNLLGDRSGGAVTLRDATWDDLASLHLEPLAGELRRHLQWKRQLSVSKS